MLQAVFDSIEAHRLLRIRLNAQLRRKDQDQDQDQDQERIIRIEAAAPQLSGVKSLTPAEVLGCQLGIKPSPNPKPQ